MYAVHAPDLLGEMYLCSETSVFGAVGHGVRGRTAIKKGRWVEGVRVSMHHSGGAERRAPADAAEHRLVVVHASGAALTSGDSLRIAGR